MAKMTVKQKRFADEYIISGNATEAAIKAGYKQRSAQQVGNENLSKPVISEYIAKRMKELDDAMIADQKEIMKALTSILRREKPDYQVVIVKKPETIKVEGSKGPYEKMVWTDYAETIEIKTKVSDVNKAAELLGKRYAMWTDKQDVNITVPVFIDDVPEDDGNE
jgi:phage terminase small subunit